MEILDFVVDLITAITRRIMLNNWWNRNKESRNCCTFRTMGFPPVSWPLVWGFGFTATMVAVMIVIYYYNEMYRVKNGTGTKNYRSCWLSSSALDPTMDQSEETAFPDAHGHLKNGQIVMSDDDEDDTRSNTSGRSNIRLTSPSNVVVLLLDRWRRKSQQRTSQCAIYHRQSASVSFSKISYHFFRSYCPSNSLQTLRRHFFQLK